MNYETCKKLKDAGLPQKEGSWISPNGEGIHPTCCPESVRLPQLEEIIEACDYGFRSLSFHTDGRWIAKAGKSNGGSLHSSKHSAKEAVAKLYLALNK